MKITRRVLDVLERTTGLRVTRRPVAKPETLLGIEPEARKIIDAASGWTMAVPLQQWATWSVTRYLAQNRIPGAIVEFGVWRGGMCQIAARTLLAAGDTDRDIFLFDTFSGMTSPTNVDRDIGTGISASDIIREGRQYQTTGGVPFTTACVADQADVTSGMESTGFPLDRVHFVRGDVLETVPSKLPKQIAFARLDTDWYESTKHELLHVWDRLCPGGVLVVDDYDAWAGSRRATDEWLDSLKFKPLAMRPGNGRLYVKYT